MGVTTIIQNLTKRFSKKPSRVGIALGGGGARGFIHFGVLQALMEKGIVVDEISGTSAGAIAGALIAAGKTPREAHEVLKKKNFFEFSKFQLPVRGLFNLEGLGEMIEQEIMVKDLENLQIPLHVTVTNLNSGNVEYLKRGSISKTVMASASIPFLFKPVVMDGDRYCDGAVLDNLPIKTLQDTCDKIIAVNISPVEETDDLNGLFKIATRTFQLCVNARASEMQSKCTLFIEPPEAKHYDLFDTKKADELFELGYAYVQQMDLGEGLSL